MKKSKLPFNLKIPSCFGKHITDDFICKTCPVPILCAVESKTFKYKQMDRLDFIKICEDLKLSSTQTIDWGCKAFKCSRESFWVYMTMYYKQKR